MNIVLRIILVIILFVIYFLVYNFGFEEGKGLVKVESIKMPPSGLEIIKNYNLTCFGWECFNFVKQNKIDCWVTIGREVKKNNETYCVIQGRSFGISCVKTVEGNYSCIESPISPYEYQRDRISILHYNLITKECCAVKSISNETYNCWNSTLRDCIAQLLR